MARDRQDYYFRPSRVDGVVRIDCIGDSMVHGSGVWPEQTFPAHLGRQLNAAFPETLIETVNHGVEGANIWGGWAAFKARWRPGSCDAVTFSVCSNDLRALEWWGIAYDHRRDLEAWEKPGFGRDLLAPLLDDMDAFIRTHRLPILVYFCSIPGLDPAVNQALEQVFGAREFAFLNTATALRAEIDGLSLDEQIFNRADGHPSSRVHEMMARHCARLLRRGGQLAGIVSQRLPGRVPGAVIDAVDAMISVGYDIAGALEWGRDLLEAKEPGLRRMVALADLAPLAEALAQARQDLGTRLAMWTHILVQPVRLVPLRAGLHAFLRESETQEGHLLVSEELSQCLALADSSLRGQVEAKLLASDWAVKEPRRDLSALSNWRGRLAELETSLAATLAGVFDPPSGPRPGPLAVLAAAASSSWRSEIQPLIAQIQSFIPRLIGQFEAVAQLEGRGLSRPVTTLLLERVGMAFACLDNQITGLETIRRDWEGCFSDLYTELRIVIGVENPSEAGGASGAQFHVTASYAAPSRLAVTQTQHVGLSDREEVYTFHFPLLVQGEVELKLTDHSRGQDVLAKRRVSLLSITIANSRVSADGVRRIERSFQGPQPDFTFARIPGLVLA